MARFWGLILVGFNLGVLAVVAAQALGLLWIMKRLRHKVNNDEACFSSKTLAAIPLLDPQQSLDFAYRKQGKKVPYQSGNMNSVIYNGSKTIYIYLDTSWEKEAWCKALYLASCDQKEKIKWFTQLDEEFHSYLTSLNTAYHSFMKPSGESSVEVIERASKPDGSSSKVRQFFKKVAKRTSRVGLENISTWTSLSGNEEKKNTEKLRAYQDAILATGLLKTASTSKPLKNSMVEDVKFGIDEGTLCWNLLISWLFFDAKGNEQLKRSVQAMIQRTLSNMRTPSYIGEVICTNINIGNVPPCIVGMRVLPMEMSEVWAVEVDIEYSGGALLEIETRLEVRELELHAGTEGPNPQPHNAGAVPSDLLEGFEYFGEQFNFAERMNDVQEQKEDGVSYQKLNYLCSFSYFLKSYLNLIDRLSPQRMSNVFVTYGHTTF